RPPLPNKFPPCDAVVHLAGENIAGGRWTPARKERIAASRVDGTRNLIRSLGRLEEPPPILVCASAIGYYGSRGAEHLDEQSASGDGFLAATCREWEEAAGEAASLGMRVVTLRFGVVLSPAGGALAKMLPPFRAGAGGRIGDGRQFMSWVSIDDTLGAIYQALFDERLSGPVNVVSPRPATNHEFTRALGRALGRPTLLPLPKPALRAMFGEMADEMLLASTRVRPHRLQEAGFDFLDVDLDRTLDRLLGKVEMR
ncbi:MAG: TIGR01777 family oxidoreductase, partial [Acidobacteriota bacterium]|nr:TIGR01777 family oxidoreductase [Acidobacteriota bacterium]